MQGRQNESAELRVRAGGLEARLSGPARLRAIREFGAVLRKLVDDEHSRATEDGARLVGFFEASDMPNPAINEVAESVAREKKLHGEKGCDACAAADAAEAIAPYSPTDQEILAVFQDYREMGGQASLRLFSILVQRFFSKHRRDPLAAWEDIAGQKESFIFWLCTQRGRQPGDDLPF